TAENDLNGRECTTVKPPGSGGRAKQWICVPVKCWMEGRRRPGTRSPRPPTLLRALGADKLHAPVERAVLVRGVRHDWHLHSIAVGGESAAIDPVVRQVLLDRGGAPLAELLVVLGAALVVRVTL